MTDAIPATKRPKGRPRKDGTPPRPQVFKPRDPGKWVNKSKKYQYVRHEIDGLKVIDEQDIIDMASEDCTVKEIAAVLCTDEDRIYRDFGAALQRGRDRGNASLRRKMFEIAMSGNVPMLIHLGKFRLGYIEAKHDEKKEQAITIVLKEVPVDERFQIMASGKAEKIAEEIIDGQERK